MDILKNAYILIDDKRIAEIAKGKPARVDRTVDCRGCVILPGLINTHVHVGDSAFKDAWFDKTLNKLFKPPEGLKHVLLKSTPKNVLVESIRDTLTDMIRTGTTTMADFREGGVEGIDIFHAAGQGLKIRSLAFGRPEYAFSEEQLQLNSGTFRKEILLSVEKFLELADGLGLSGANELTDDALKQLSKIAQEHGKFKAIHVAEHPESREISKRRTGLTEVERSVRHFNPNLLVHLIYAIDEELKLVADRRVAVACCPRANATLRLRLPKIAKMLDSGIDVALGTDNVMLCSPDMWREMEFTSKAYCISPQAERRLEPREILKMATINGAKALRIHKVTGSLVEGKLADLVAVDFHDANLRNTYDVILALTNRARPDNVRLTMIEGEVAYDRDSKLQRTAPKTA